MEMSVAKKLFGLSALNVMLMAAIGGVGYWGLSGMTDDVDQMLQREAKMAEHSTRAQVNVLGLRRYEKDLFINMHDPAKVAEYEKKFLDQHQRLMKQFDGLGRVIDREQDKKRLDGMQADVAEYTQGLNGVLEKIRAGEIKTTQEANKAIGRYKENIHRMEANAERSSSDGVERMALVKDELDGRARHTVWMIAGFAALAMAAGMVLSALIVRGIVTALRHAVRVATVVAQGDLTGTIEVKGNDETAKLLAALKSMNAKLYQIVSEVQVGTASVGSAAKQISAGNADLSSRTQEQASALEETASSMEEMTSTVKQNADNARQANQLANGARDQAEKGGQVVSKAVSAMGEINSSSRKIADIISVIDEIAFQTNLLALNAAVEAARAGEQGRGFAVVASEVRNLAQRSAGAAKEIKTLINDSVDKVKAGSELVDESGRTLTQIVESVKKVTDIVAEIAAASQEQAAGIDQVNKAVMQMDEVTQQNAALVEEAAAASRSMEEQAANLNTQMAFFKIGDAAAITVKPAAGMAPKAGKGNGAAHPGNGASHPAHGHLAEAVHTRLAAVRRNPTPTAANGSDGDGQWKEF